MEKRLNKVLIAILIMSIAVPANAGIVESTLEKIGRSYNSVANSITNSATNLKTSLEDLGKYTIKDCINGITRRLTMNNNPTVVTSLKVVGGAAAVASTIYLAKKAYDQGYISAAKNNLEDCAYATSNSILSKTGLKVVGGAAAVASTVYLAKKAYDNDYISTAKNITSDCIGTINTYNPIRNNPEAMTGLKVIGGAAAVASTAYLAKKAYDKGYISAAMRNIQTILPERKRGMHPLEEGLYALRDLVFGVPLVLIGGGLAAAVLAANL